MKTYHIQTYYFNELSEAAQRRAYITDWSIDPHDAFSGEFRATLAAFEKAFNITVCNWEVDSARYTFDFILPTSNADEINDPLRLACYVWNNYAPRIKRGKYYGNSKRLDDGRYSYKTRHSRVTFEMDNCPLTGVFCDCDILQAALDCMNYKRNFATLDDLITTSLNEFFTTWRDCLEYSESFEYYADEAEANAWEYTADGARFNAREVCTC